MKRPSFLLLLLTGVLTLNAEIKRILFIGNSYIYTNDLPGTLQAIAMSMGDTLLIDQYVPGGYTFNQHNNDPQTKAKIMQGDWDFVVLQEQSQIPSFSPAQVATDCLPYAKKLCDTVRAYNPCAEIFFYMTWGRKNGDAGNCASYPPVCTYAGMQQRLRESYLLMADSNEQSCSPVGAVWNVMRNQYPLVDLYSADESHPSPYGTYLAACTFYCSLYHRALDSNTYVSPGVLGTTAWLIQGVASQVVLDSLETWQQYGKMPRAKFLSVISGNSVSFTNQSLRYTSSSWNFGDGSPSNNTPSPTHAFAAAGSYAVELTVWNDTCRSAIYVDTVIVSGPAGLSQVSEPSMEIIVAEGQLIPLRGTEGMTVQLYDAGGRKVWVGTIDVPSRQMLPALPGGVCFWSLVDRKGIRRLQGKLLARP